MNVEIINTSQKPLTYDLEEALRAYAAYHIYSEADDHLIIHVEKLLMMSGVR